MKETFGKNEDEGGKENRGGDEWKWKREEIELIHILKYQPKIAQAKRQVID